MYKESAMILYTSSSISIPQGMHVESGYNNINSGDEDRL